MKFSGNLMRKEQFNYCSFYFPPLIPGPSPGGRMEKGEWRRENGEWRMEKGEGRMEKRRGVSAHNSIQTTP
jgi:hypothetical protein